MLEDCEELNEVAKKIMRISFLPRDGFFGDN